MKKKSPLDDVRALTFDVFGTVVDWRGSIIRQLRRFARERGAKLDAAAFADAWRGAYAPSMDRVRRGDLPWTTIDALHRGALDELLDRHGLGNLGEVDRDWLNRCWHRLDPWPDSRRGLAALKRRFVLATLSNGNIALLTNMAKYARLPWDCVLSAELAGHYKPDPEAYLTAVRLLGLEPRQVMMVAAHAYDLHAAAALGLRTALVERPLEFGPVGTSDRPDPAFDVNASDLLDLARRLGC